MVFWRACVEAELAFFEEENEVMLGDAVIFSEDTLGLAPEVFDTVNVVMLLLGKVRRMIDAMMMKA